MKNVERTMTLARARWPRHVCYPLHSHFPLLKRNAMAKKKAAVIGATGVAGQQFLAALSNHPWFEVTALAASERSAGKAYKDAITDANGAFRWYCQEPLDPAFAKIRVQDASRLDATGVDVVFTAVESDAARHLEPLYAKTTPVVSTASAFRSSTCW